MSPLRCDSRVASPAVSARDSRADVGAWRQSACPRHWVALARAVYANRDIVILDDPLSALDVHVGKEVFGELVKKHLKDKTVVLVTHDWGLLSSADKIIFLEDGSVSVSKSVEKMAEASETFRTLLAQHKIDVSADDDAIVIIS